MLALIDLDNTLNDRAGAVVAWVDAFCASRGLPPDAAAWIVANDADGYGDQQHKIDALGFRELVDAAVVSGEAGVAKPDRRIFELAAETVGAGLDGAWVVGDSAPHDIEGANRLGLRSIWIRRGRHLDPDGPTPTAIVDSLDEIPPLIVGSAGLRSATESGSGTEAEDERGLRSRVTSASDAAHGVCADLK